MKTLIVNADDFGLTPGVNEGILRAFREGILTSTTLMANAPAFDDAVARTREHPDIDVGCHLVLVGGKSVAPPEEIPSLAKRNGDLPNTLFELVCRLWGGLVVEADIEREFRAQIERVIAAGITPSHLDTHKHADPVWAPIFEGYKPVQAWLAEKRPDVLFFIFNSPFFLQIARGFHIYFGNIYLGFTRLLAHLWFTFFPWLNYLLIPIQNCTGRTAL